MSRPPRALIMEIQGFITRNTERIAEQRVIRSQHMKVIEQIDCTIISLQSLVQCLKETVQELSRKEEDARHEAAPTD